MRDDSPSATAYLIAKSTCFLSHDPVLRSFVPQLSAELSELFIQSRYRFSSWLNRLTDSKLFRPLARALERATIPGIKLHYALRKRYLEEVARATLGDGIRQIVVIGAGFDTLALRLHEKFPETQFFEVDHPATQRIKKRVVESNGQLRSNLHFVAQDLAHDSLEDGLLKHADYSPDDETLFIVEGLLMYLTPEEVNRIFRFVQTHSGRSSKFAFTFMETQRDGRIGFRKSSHLVGAWLRLRGESFKWGIGRECLNGFIASRGFRALEIVTSETLRSMYLTTQSLKHLPLAEGECICIAGRN